MFCRFCQSSSPFLTLVAKEINKMDTRHNMLEVLKNGLLASGRTTFLHRMVYVGEHGMGRHAFEEHMKDVVASQLDQGRDEVLTGFLLVYQKHFLHMVEGSEGTLTRHLKSVVEPDDQELSHVRAAKIIFEVAHINKRQLATWTSRIALPPTLAEQLKDGAGASVSEVARHVDTVLSKLQRLLDALKKLPPGAPLSQQLALQLPEPELLQLVLATPLIKDVRTILKEHAVPPRITLYDDLVWPVQSDFVPCNIFDVVGEAEPAAPADQEQDRGDGAAQDGAAQDGVLQDGVPQDGEDGPLPESAASGSQQHLARRTSKTSKEKQGSSIAQREDRGR